MYGRTVCRLTKLPSMEIPQHRRRQVVRRPALLFLWAASVILSIGLAPAQLGSAEPGVLGRFHQLLFPRLLESPFHPLRFHRRNPNPFRRLPFGDRPLSQGVA